MLQVNISSWRLRDLAKTHPDRYRFLQEHQDGLDSLEKALEGKNYTDFQKYVNEIELLPDWMLELVELKVMKPMQLLKPEGGIDSRELKDLIKKSQVHLPGNELLYINEVVVHSDACTESLQKELDDGWRIVAVCPQASQRRPDYVLGRHTPKPTESTGPF